VKHSSGRGKPAPQPHDCLVSSFQSAAVAYNCRRFKVSAG